ncbi:MAG TPA: lipoyl domain-containing protein, partial [Candidatus Binatia bacterium]|nr:lipoyl domain-containing protein [Candidatus Binatia bacterium]
MDIKLPQLAEGVESGTVVAILVAEGQDIKKDQPIMELETQKAVGSIPAPASGIVTKIHVKEGMEISVGQLLITIREAAGEAVTSPAAAAPSPVERRAVEAYPRRQPESGA